MATPAPRHHAYVTTIGGDTISDNTAWLDSLDREPDPEMPQVPLSPVAKAAATRQRKKDHAAAEAATSARQQARRERYQAWAKRFPEAARQRLAWFDRAAWRGGNLNTVDTTPQDERSLLEVVKRAIDDREHQKALADLSRVATPERRPGAPVERRTWEA